MTNEEIKEIMSKNRTTQLLNEYFNIYQLATGKEFKSCLCGDGFNVLYNTCKNYALKLK